MDDVDELARLRLKGLLQFPLHTEEIYPAIEPDQHVDLAPEDVAGAVEDYNRRRDELLKAAAGTAAAEQLPANSLRASRSPSEMAESFPSIEENARAVEAKLSAPQSAADRLLMAKAMGQSVDDALEELARARLAARARAAQGLSSPRGGGYSGYVIKGTTKDGRKIVELVK